MTQRRINTNNKIRIDITSLNVLGLLARNKGPNLETIKPALKAETIFGNIISKRPIPVATFLPHKKYVNGEDRIAKAKKMLF